MAFPKIDVPLYDLVIPSTGEKIKIRPFLVKEEKILLMALESGNEKEMISAVKQIVNNCIVSKCDVDKLATFDVEFVFMTLRARSVGDIIELTIKGAKDSECEGCKATKTVKIKIDDIKIKRDPNHTNKIVLDSEHGLGVMMKYPTFDTVLSLQAKEESATETAMQIICKCVSSFYDSKQTYDISDETEESVMEFLENLNSKQFGNIQKFLETMPKLSHTVKIKCPECGKVDEYVLEGIKDFFA